MIHGCASVIAGVAVTAGQQPGVWSSIDNFHISVAAPVPEPQTWAMLAGGLGIMGWMGRRRQKRA